MGGDPDDWKTMDSVGPGVREIRIRDGSGIFRVMYVAKFSDAIFVLHCFQKKTQKTAPGDLALAKRRYKEVGEGVKPMKVEAYDNVWDAIENDAAVAENLKLRSVLMIAIKNHIRHEAWTQAEAAKLLGVTQPRISNLMRGKINSFGLDMLVKMAIAAGLQVSMKVKKAA